MNTVFGPIKNGLEEETAELNTGLIRDYIGARKQGYLRQQFHKFLNQFEWNLQRVWDILVDEPHTPCIRMINNQGRNPYWCMLHW